MIVFELRTLFTINIVLLAAGPILLIALVYTKHVVLNRRVHPHNGEELPEEEGAHPGVLQNLFAGFKSFGWLGNLWRLGKFWLALVVGVALQVLLVVGYIYLNPFVCDMPLTHAGFLLTRFDPRYRSCTRTHTWFSRQHSPSLIYQQSYFSISPFHWRSPNTKNSQ